MERATMSELFSRHGLFLCDLDDQGMPLLDGDDEFQNTYQHVSLLVGQDHDLGTGTLHTSVRAMTMHAMSDDTDVHERPCIYCQVDSVEAICDLDEGCDLASNELLLVPRDSDEVKPVFEALCKGAEANPDEIDDDEGDFFFDADEMCQGLNQNEHANLDEMVGRLQLGTLPADAAQNSGAAPPSALQLSESGSEGDGQHER